MADEPAQSGRRARRTTLPVERVSIDFVLLADFAQAVNNKLTVVGGGWNICNPTSYPTLLPFGLGLGFLVPWGETHRPHAFKFVIRKSEGAQIAEGHGDFRVGQDLNAPPGMTQRLVLGLSGQVQLQEPGTYEVTVSTEHAEKTIIFEAMAPPR